MLSVAPTEEIRVATLAGMVDVPAEAWNALVDDDDPFLEHAFLAALERSGSVGEGTGWEPRILVARQAGQVVGAVPLYLRQDSMGEFIWDFAWAYGARNAGIRYYPKLVAAVPFTPATGQRLLVHRNANRALVVGALVAAMRSEADACRASSIHVLFCRPDEARELVSAGFLSRASFQYHWSNPRTTPYHDFGDFLGTFRSRSRKQIRHERTLVGDYGLRIEVVPGTGLDDRAWAALDRHYRSTVDQYGNVASLTPAFFDEIRKHHANRLLAVLAYRGNEPIAATTNFIRGGRLFGRYWGADAHLPMLHFELCFYRLIEHAIATGVRTFEGGAGGDHKLKRGLLPERTYSAHWIRHPGLAQAVAQYVRYEGEDVDAQMRACMEASPYSQNPKP
jgi:uncharacterized protein